MAARQIPLPQLSRHLLPSSALRCSSRQGSALTAQSRQRRYQSTKAASSPDFKGQLYQSTHQRLERERAEQRKFAAERGESTQGRNAALTFVILASSLTFYYLGSLNPSAPTNLSSTLPLHLTPTPTHNTTRSNLQAAYSDLVAIVGAENVSTLPSDLAHHSTSTWSSHQPSPSHTPTYIVSPSTTAEVSSILSLCHMRRIPVTPYSGGTSLEGNYTPTRGGITLSFARMASIVAIHPEDLDCVVQPGVGWEVLNQTLEAHNLFFPPDPGPGAQIGGMIGTGCSGTNAYRYGTMKEWVLSLTVVMADGTVIRTRQRARKSSAGYDLTRLIVGSEGTLGVVTEAVLRVAVRPASQSVAVASFDSVRAAAECVARVVAAGIPVAALELLDSVQIRCINASGATSRDWAEQPTLFVKFAGTEAGVREQVRLVRNLANQHACRAFDFARTATESDELWSARKDALWSVMGLRRNADDRVWTTDVAVPISRLPDIIEETQADLARSGLLGGIVGHAGDGNFHAFLLFNEAERALAEGVVHRMVKRAIELEGTVTGEHGVGLVKRDYLAHELGESTVDAMRKLKLAFDPLCILNCDKVIRVEPSTAKEEKW